MDAPESVDFEKILNTFCESGLAVAMQGLEPDTRSAFSEWLSDQCKPIEYRVKKTITHSDSLLIFSAELIYDPFFRLQHLPTLQSVIAGDTRLNVVRVPRCEASS